MQFKKLMSSSAIASVAFLTMVGAAHAATFTTTVSTHAAGANGLPVANEIAFTADAVVGDDPDDGQAVIAVDRSGGTFPSGNLVLRLTLTGATFDGAMTAGSVTFDAGCAGATSILSSGGANSSTTVNYVLSNLDSCTLLTDGFIVTAPFDLDGPSNASLTMSLVTESGDVPVDNINNSVINLVQSVSAYTIDIDTTGYTPVTADVSAAAGPYLNFVGGSPQFLGDFEVAVRTGAAIDLNGAGPATFASTADIAGITATLNGSMSAYTGAGDVFLDGVNATITGSNAVATFPAGGAPVASASAAGTLNISDEVVALIPSLTAQIQASAYNLTVALDLVAGLTDESLTAPVLPVTRNGTNAILAWTASSTQAATSGQNTFVRVSNPTSQDYGPIFATVLSSSVPATVNTTATLATSLAAGAEAVFTAAQLQTALGNYGRGDILIVVEGNGATIKRLVQRANGETLEINNVGVIGANAN